METGLTNTNAILRTAFEHHQKQQLTYAINLYNIVLKRDKSNFDALQLLGLCYYQSGQLETALRLLNKALSIQQDVASVFNHRGIVLRALGRNNDSIPNFDRAINLEPRLADAFYNKGNALRDLGKLEDARRNLEKALQLKPNKFEFLNNLGGVLKELHHHSESLQCYNQLLSLYPNSPDGYSNRGVVLHELERFHEALASYDKAINLKPDYAEAYSNRGNALKELYRLDEALASYDKAISLNPDYAEAYSNRGVALKEMKRLEEALASFDKTLSLKPDHAEAWLGLARIDSETGRFKEAEEKYEKVRSLDPNRADPLCGIAEIRKFDANDPLIQIFQERLSDKTLSDEGRARLHHAYAKICNDLGHYDDAIAHFSLGKVLLKSKFDIERHSAGYSAMKQLFTRQFFAERRGFGLLDERPVFIVGMPRSGTTLTEQILASHRLVDGLGELQDIPEIIEKLGGQLHKPSQFTDAVVKLQAAEVNKMAERYCEVYKRSGKACIRLIDKRPDNYEWLAIIALMFPKAYIIHCRRDALDNCVSMYMQNFKESHGYNLDFATLGRYYREYEDLMKHWKDVLPLPIHEHVYENTVNDFEASVRSLVLFLGLEWDPNCLNYHQHDRQVSTLSRWQVRQPLYDKSLGRWRRYEKHLGPLKEALGVS